MLAFGLVPTANVKNAWQAVADWGLEQIGDYGAFWYQMALSSSYFAPGYDTPDDGTAMLTALTKCDTDSWCSGLRDDNLTTTRESWHAGTYSHGWGSSAIVGVTWGIMGLQQTAPTFASFTVKPKLGSLSHANITVPTIRGFIEVSAGPGWLNVNVPCNSVASLCLPRTSLDHPNLHSSSTTLLLDFKPVDSDVVGGQLCVREPVGCGTLGSARILRAVGP